MAGAEGVGQHDVWLPFTSSLGRDLAASGDRWQVRTGTVLKVDLSGFTTLSERLARVERTGAETLNAALVEVFTGLVAALDAEGGDVVAFGGDAVAVWFEGTDHRVRATRAATACHRFLAARPAEATPAGAVRLRASAGLASGDVLVGLVGVEHAEPVLLGPTVTAALAAEARSASGRTLAAPLGTPAIAPLVRAVAGGSRAAAPVTGAAGGAARFVPTAVRALVVDGELPGEHRRAVSSFVGLVGLDALLAAGDAAGAVAAVEHLVAGVERACAATGTVWTAADVAADGVVLLLFAGAPVAAEHEAARVHRALGAIVADPPPAGELRAGAFAGRLFAGVLGAPSRRTWAAIGDTTNTAARLMGRAPAGAALVAADLAAAAGDRDAVVLAGEQVALRLKGRAAPVAAVVVRAEATTPSGPLATADPAGSGAEGAVFVGREAETASLVAALTAVRDGGRAAVLLVGPAGIGKSRLLAEALADVPGGAPRVVRGRATPFDVASAYAALRPALLALVGDDVAGWGSALGDEAELVPLLGPALGVDVPATPASRAVEPAFVATTRDRLLASLVAHAVDEPVVVVVEDGQFLDRGSLGLLDALAALDTGPGLGVVVALRDPAGEGTSPSRWPQRGDAWTTTVLAPLTETAARRLVVDAAGTTALDDLTLDGIVAEAAGNPLFLRELATLAAGGGVGSTLPATTEAVIAARIDLLPPPARVRLREAAVAGEGPLALVAAATGRAELGTGSGWRELAGFADVAPSRAGAAAFRFHHDLYRRGAYEGLAVRRRREIHAGLADLLEPSGDPAATAMHAEAAGQHDRAALLARRAGTQAAAQGSWGDALRSYERAWACGLRARRDAPWLADVAERRAGAADLLGRYSLAESSLREALRREPAASPRVVARRRTALAAALERQGRYRAALAELTRAERALAAGVGDGGWPAVALRRSSVLYRRGRLRESLALAARVAERPGTTRADRARALLRVEMCAGELALPTRDAAGREALAAFRGLRADRDLASLLGNLGVSAFEADDWRLAERRYRESRERYRRAGDVVGAAIVENNLAELLCEQGRVEEAHVVFGEARRVFRAAGLAIGVAATTSSLGRLAARTGDHGTAGELLAEAEAEFRGLGNPVYVADTLVRKAELALLSGDAATPEHIDAALAAVREADAGVWPRLVCDRYLALWQWRRGDSEAAVAALMAARDDAVGHGVVAEELLCLEALLAATSTDVVSTPGRGEWSRRREELAAHLGVVASSPLPH